VGVIPLTQPKYPLHVSVAEGCNP